MPKKDDSIHILSTKEWKSKLRILADSKDLTITSFLIESVDKYEMLLEERTKLVQGYIMLYEFFLKLIDNAEKIISDFGLMSELINNYIDKDKLKKLNWTLGLE